MKCKHCHAPDDLNGIGLCKHCMAIVKDEIKAGKDRLDAIYDRFPEDLEGMEESERRALLEETRELYELLDRYHRMGFPVGSYVMPVRKALHFLDPEGGEKRRIFARRLRETGARAAVFAVLAVVCAVSLTAIGNNTAAKLGEAVKVSASADAGADAPGMEGEENGGPTADSMEGAQPAEAGEEGEPPEPGGDPVDPAAEAPEAESEASADADGGESGDEESGGGEAAEETGTAAPAPAPVRVSGGGAVIVGEARAVAILG